MKTAELQDAALDWAVAKIELEAAPHKKQWVMDGLYAGNVPAGCDYSTDWLCGGPIIERERITLDYFEDGGHPDGGEWAATYFRDSGLGHTHLTHEGFGPTPLIAVMRCYVASKLGDDVDIPEELR